VQICGSGGGRVSRFGRRQATLPKNQSKTEMFAAKKTQPAPCDMGQASKFWNYG
jgi:hypothetical protein